MTLLMLVAMAYQANPRRELVLGETPCVTLPELEGCDSRPLEKSEMEEALLSDDTGVVKREYHDRSGETFVVTAVISGPNRSSIHRPEACMTGQGFRMERVRTLSAAGADWSVKTLVRDGGQTLGLAYTFYSPTGSQTSSYVMRIALDVWSRSVFGRIDRWVYVSVASSTTDDAVLADFLGRLWSALK